MQHATDVFMFSVCAAHKKVNEQHPRNWRQVSSITAMASTVGHGQETSAGRDDNEFSRFEFEFEFEEVACC